MLTPRKDTSGGLQHESSTEAIGQARASSALELENDTASKSEALLGTQDIAFESAPNQDGYQGSTDEPRPPESEDIEGFEYVRISDPQGDYMIRRPVREEIRARTDSVSDSEENLPVKTTVAELKKQFLSAPNEDQNPDDITLSIRSSTLIPGEESLHTRSYDKMVERYTQDGVEFDAFWRCVSSTTESQDLC